MSFPCHDASGLQSLYLPLWEAQRLEQSLAVGSTLSLEVEHLDANDDLWSHCFAEPLHWLAVVDDGCEQPGPVQVAVDRLFAAFAPEPSLSRTDADMSDDHAPDEGRCYCLPVPRATIPNAGRLEPVGPLSPVGGTPELQGWVLMGRFQQAA